MPQDTDAPAPPDTGLACLLLVARWHGLAAEPALLRHRFGEPGAPFGSTGILRAARDLGLKAREIATTAKRQGLVFRAAVELDRPFIEWNGGRLPIGPGLAATVEITTGTRRVIEYVLSPLLRYRAAALRER